MITLSDHLVNIPVGARSIIKAALATVKAVAPNAEELACQTQQPKSKSAMWKLVRYAKDGKVVLTIGTFTDHASMFFARGAELDDEEALLEGSGKALRYITMRTPSDAQGPAIEAVIRQAFALT